MRWIIVSLFCTSAFCVAYAQGLKGAPDCPRGISQPVPMIRGKSDLERWSNFQKVQPSLIGMTYEQVVKTLGKGKAFVKSDDFTLKARTKQDCNCLLYQIAETKIPGRPGKKAPIELTIVFRGNAVQSFLVESAY